MFAFAGLWEAWTGPQGETRSFTITTTEPNALMVRIHDRMPAIVPSTHYGRWLDPDLRDPAQIQAMIASCPATDIEAVSVGRAVSSVRNQGPELMTATGAPLTREPAAPASVKLRSGRPSAPG